MCALHMPGNRVSRWNAGVLAVWRLLSYRLQLEKLGVTFKTIPTWLLWLLAILGTLLAAAWIALLMAWAFSPPELGSL